MKDKLSELGRRFDELRARMGDPSIFEKPGAYQVIAKEAGQLEPLVTTFRRLEAVERELAGALELAGSGDADLRAMAHDEIEALSPEQARLTAELRLLLLPKDPNDEKNVVLEVRAGTGGDEAALFAGDLFRMYARFAQTMGWTVEMLSASAGEAGGFKEVIASVAGPDAWSRLKYESGVHRVQRVPATEAQGRIHTSTCTVALMPEAEEVDVQVDPGDLRIDVFRASGPGGQSVNTTDSAVRITHLPTGIVVSCQNEKSQIQNRAAAMRVLQSRLLEVRRREEREKMNALKTDTAGSWGTQMRSYVLHPYQMVKDLRTEHETGNTSAVLDGEIDDFVETGIRWRRQQETRG